MKKEYRGTRSVDAMNAFLLEQIRDPVTKVASLDELTKLTDPANRIKSQVIFDYSYKSLFLAAERTRW